ncbi:MAG TPA: SGNH/GDSL hydrolase family protein [Planctomycetota bacterium]
MRVQQLFLRPALLCGLLLLCGYAVSGDTSVITRGNLENCRTVFTLQKKGHVAFLGGSITEMEGYRPMVCELLRKRFPETEFTITAAGIASTTSMTGAFRLKDDVLSKGPVDLLLVDSAVNDDQDGHHSKAECLRAAEGIVRNLRQHNPKADVIFVEFVNEGLMDQYRKNQTPIPMAAHEEVAAAYKVSIVNVCKAVTARIDAKEITWKQFGGVHPAPFGNRIAADMIGELMDQCWKEPLAAGATPKDNSMPAKPLDELNYGGGRFLDPKEAKISEDWQLHVPDWKALPGGKRDRFNKLTMLESTKPGAALTLEFAGSAIGAYIVAGPDAGIVEVSIDGGPTTKCDLYHHFSGGLHYPRTVMFADTLSAGKHTLSLKLSADKNAASKGTAIRAMQFVVNEGK